MAGLFRRCWQRYRETTNHQIAYAIIGSIGIVFCQTVMLEMIEKLAGGKSANWSGIVVVGPHKWIPPETEEDFNLTFVVLAFSITFMISCVFFIYGGWTRQKEFSRPWRMCETAVMFHQMVTAFAIRLTENKQVKIITEDTVVGFVLVIYTLIAEETGWWYGWPVFEGFDIVFEMQPPENQQPVAAPPRAAERVAETPEPEPQPEPSGFSPTLDVPFADEYIEEDAIASSHTSELRKLSKELAAASSAHGTLISGITVDETHSKPTDYGIELKAITRRTDIEEYDDQIVATSLTEMPTQEPMTPSSGEASTAFAITLAEIHPRPADNDTESATGSDSQKSMNKNGNTDEISDGQSKIM